MARPVRDSDRLLPAAAVLLPAAAMSMVLVSNPAAWPWTLGLVVVAVVAAVVILASP